jgi:hypothetical protein
MISFFQHFLQILQNQEFTCAKISTVINRNFPTAVCAYQVYTGFHYTHGRTGLGGGGGRQPPQFVGQTKPVGQYSLYSRAILAYYKKKWDKFCQFCGKFRNIWKISRMFRKI